MTYSVRRELSSVNAPEWVAATLGALGVAAFSCIVDPEPPRAPELVGLFLGALAITLAIARPALIQSEKRGGYAVFAIGWSILVKTGTVLAQKLM